MMTFTQNKFEFIDRLRDNSLGRDFIVGDIHGCYQLLMDELNKVNFNDTKDRLFSVGDLIDRGPDSFKCANLVYEPWFFAVQGNHERMFFTYILGNHSYTHDPVDIFRNGGKWIYEYDKRELRSLAIDMQEKMPLVNFVGGKKTGFAVTHAKMEFEEDPDVVVWNRDLMYEIQQHKKVNLDFNRDFNNEVQQHFMLGEFDQNKRVVYVGHNTLKNGHVVEIGNHVMLDTAAYDLANCTDGRVTYAKLTLVEHRKECFYD